MSDKDKSMKKVIGLDLWDIVKKHGIPFIMALLAIYYFHLQNVELQSQIGALRTEIKTCQDEKTEILLNALNDNTKAIEKVSFLLEAQAKR